MVFPGERDCTATEHERSKTRHNFTLPNWGTQRNLRCFKVESHGAGEQRIRRRSSPSEFDGGATTTMTATRFRFGDQRRDDRNRRLETEPCGSAEDGGEEGIEEYRKKIMSDLRLKTESIFREQALGVVVEEEEEEEEEEEKDDEKERRKEEEKKREVSPPEAPGVAAEARPWNLRKRRAAACKTPVTETGNSVGDHYNYKGLGKQMNPPILGIKFSDPTKQKFLSTLSKKEIEEDYMKMIAHRPPRRPKKRPRTVQKQINLLHPAFYFTEINEELYEVPDAAENRKR